MLIQLGGFDDDIMGLAAVSLRSSLKYRRNWNKNGPTVQLLRKFMPRGSKGFRVYAPIGSHSNRINILPPLQVRLAVKQAGFRITDYLAKKCVKLTDKEQKNVFNIGKVIAKDSVAKAAFDNDPQLQNSSTAEFTMVISCHPYDIIGMSTGRSWDNESCMRLGDYRDRETDGINMHYLERDVAEGTLVAYAIRTNDTNIESPLGRCLLKPFVKDNGTDILYRRETKIYGNPVPGFAEALQLFLRKLNAGVPAGQYSLNERLYNDGVGGRFNQEESGTDTKAVNWGRVGDSDKLTERPDLFPSFVAHIIKQIKSGKTDADDAMSAVAYAARNIPATYCKQAARIIAADRATTAGFVQVIHDQKNGYEYTKPFLKSKALLKTIREVVKDRPYKNWAETSTTGTLFGGNYAHAYYENMDKNSNAYWDTTKDLLAGELNLLPSDIQSNPEFHRVVYFLATLDRDASAFDYDQNQETAHKLLTTLPPIDIKLDDAFLAQFKKFLRYYEEYREPSAAYVLKLMKDGEVENANSVAMSITEASFTNVMKSRKYARRFLALKNPEKGLRLLIANAAANLLLSHAGNDEAVARDIHAIIRRMPSFDAITAPNYYNIVRSFPDLYANVYYTDFKDDKNAVDYAIKQLTNLESCHAVQARDNKVNFAPVSDIQERMWGLHGTLLAIDSMVESPIMVEYNTDEWISILAGLKHSLSNLGDVNIDLAKYPQFLTADTAKKLSPAQFINGKDNGITIVNLLAQQGMYALSEVIQEVFAEDPMVTMVNTFSGVKTRSESMMITHIKNLLNKPTIDEAQEFYDNCDGFVQVVRKFVERMLPEKGAGFAERFAPVVNQPVDVVQADIIAVLPIYDTLNKYLEGAEGSMGLFMLLGRRSDLKFNPAYS